MNKKQKVIQTLSITIINTFILIGILLVTNKEQFSLLVLSFLGLSFLFTGIVIYLGNRKSFRMFYEVKRVIARFNEGDFTARIHYKTKDSDFLELKNQFETLRNMLNTWIYELLHSAVSIKIAANKINVGSDRSTKGMDELNLNLSEISQFFDETSSMLNDVSIAAEHLSRSGKHIALNSLETVDSVRSVNETATNGGAAISQVNACMQEMQKEVSNSYHLILELEKASQEIGSITETITSISEQTNMLALNASIESARAGEHGKGFAVVANEVRKLSEETKEAANQINHLIHTVQLEVSQTVTSMTAVNTEVEIGVNVTKKANDNLKNIISVTKEALSLIESISNEAEEQSHKTNLISNNTKEVAEKSQTGTATVQEISCVMENQAEDVKENNDTTHELLLVSNNLENVMEKFDKTLGEQMLAVCSHIAKLHNKKPLSHEDLNSLIQKFGLSEIHLINDKGVIEITSNNAILGFQFSDKEGSQTYEFSQILKNPTLKVNQKSAFRDVDGKLFKYSGLSTHGKSGIVQCGLEASKMMQFSGI